MSSAVSTWFTKLKWGPWLRTLLGAGISAFATAFAANPIASAIGAQQFSPRQLVIFSASAAIVAMAMVLQKSPLPEPEVERTIAIALQPGVHTSEEVKKVLKATAPGVIPSDEVTAAILGKSVQQRISAADDKKKIREEKEALG